MGCCWASVLRREHGAPGDTGQSKVKGRPLSLSCLLPTCSLGSLVAFHAVRGLRVEGKAQTEGRARRAAPRLASTLASQPLRLLQPLS